MAAGVTTNLANVNDVHVAVLPDLSNEEIPDERITFDELDKLKTLPVSMSQKRLLKSQLAVSNEFCVRLLSGYSGIVSNTKFLPVPLSDLIG